MKDKYREETNKDVYPETTIIDCNSNCGSYTDDYVHWLEKHRRSCFEEVLKEVWKFESFTHLETWLKDKIKTPSSSVKVGNNEKAKEVCCLNCAYKHVMYDNKPCNACDRNYNKFKPTG